MNFETLNPNESFLQEVRSVRDTIVFADLIGSQVGVYSTTFLRQYCKVIEQQCDFLEGYFESLLEKGSLGIQNIMPNSSFFSQFDICLFQISSGLDIFMRLMFFKGITSKELILMKDPETFEYNLNMFYAKIINLLRNETQWEQTFLTLS